MSHWVFQCSLIIRRKTFLKWQLIERLWKNLSVVHSEPCFLGSWSSIGKLGKKIPWVSYCFYFDINLWNTEDQNKMDNLLLGWNEGKWWIYECFFPPQSQMWLPQCTATVYKLLDDFFHSLHKLPPLPLLTPPTNFLASTNIPKSPFYLSPQEKKPKILRRTHFEISFSGLSSHQGMILQLPHKPLCKLFKSMENFWGNCPYTQLSDSRWFKNKSIFPITNLWFEKSNLINLLPLFFSSLS